MQRHSAIQKSGRGKFVVGNYLQFCRTAQFNNSARLRKARQCGSSTVAPPRASGVKEGAPIYCHPLRRRRVT
jgi:hypothetical protein